MIEKDSRKEIGEYVFLSKYAKVINGKKEAWDEAVERVMTMHTKRYLGVVSTSDRKQFNEMIETAKRLYKEKRVLGAQRALQYGGELMMEKNARLFNCAATYIDRVEVYKELMYLLLCGCGTGYSVQNCHIGKLPKVKGVDIKQEKIFVIPDTIEGWAEAIGKLMESYFYGLPVQKFDYSMIRPKGAPIRGGFRAPGPKPLEEAIEKIRGILSKIKDRKLTAFENHHILCIIANAVVTGGVRRSAMIALFDSDDEEMMKCKTGDWMETMPELCRCNNSAVILPTTPKETYERIFENTKIFGEPGFVFLRDKNYVMNPCAEVLLFPAYIDSDGFEHSGWGFCNLTEINGGKIKTKEDFYEACEAAAILGTLQAGYTDFDVIKFWSKRIADRDALIGVGITGLCENPDILFDPVVQKTGAKLVVETNKKLAKILHMNSAARCTVVKPSGNSSQLLGTLSGITLGHSKHYIRHIQASETEQCVQEWERVNPKMVKKSVWNPTREKVIAFPVTLPDNSLLRKNFSAVDFLKLVLLTKRNWIEYGTNFDNPTTKAYPSMRMNVSNTCTVKPDEWDDVKEFIWSHRLEFGGISLLSYFGDMDYPQAPYTEVLDEKELVERYGAGAILSSGLIVDAEKVFNDIWEACNAAIGLAPNLLKLTNEDISEFIIANIHNGKFLVDIEGVQYSDVNCVIDFLKRRVENRLDWVRRFKSFAKKYCEGDIKKTAYCLKHVNAYHTWQQICKMQPVDYSNIKWVEVKKEAGSEVASACAGGSCSLDEYRH